MTPTCTGYWVNVQAYDYTAPPAYRCLTQAEYDAFNAQHAAGDAQEMYSLGIIAVCIIGVAIIIALLVALWHKYNNSKGSER